MLALELINKYSSVITDINQMNGFHEANTEPLERERKFMLIITELCEAVEGDRKGHWIRERMQQVRTMSDCWKSPEEDGQWMNFFETHIKDLVEDELADTAIRMIDWSLQFKVPITQYFYGRKTIGNFPVDILMICKRLFKFLENTGSNYDFSLAFISLVTLAEAYNVDLDWHIDQKLKYNALRGYKHGNKAY
jgi:hypothetical protein